MQQKLVAVVNDELVLVNKNFLGVWDSEELHNYFERISETITEKVVSNRSFKEAVGADVVEDIWFDVVPACMECEHCDTLYLVVDIAMFVKDVQTDFHYGYIMMTEPHCDDPEQEKGLLYSFAGKTYIVVGFEQCCNGVTSGKTLKNFRSEDSDEVSLENIFAEILSETDLIIC